MELFEQQIEYIRAFMDTNRGRADFSEHVHRGQISWPTDRNRNLVMAQDTAVELGNPKDASASFLIWINDPEKIKHGRITLIGPDLAALSGRQASFGKVVLLGGTGFDADNSYDRYREMELLRYDLHLKGYMMRAVSQYGREWSRVSKEALFGGFSFQTLGGGLIDQFLNLDYVHAAEVLFVTSGKDDVIKLQQIASGVSSIIGAMNKMADDLTFDCDECEYNAICEDVADLRAVHRAMKGKGN